MDWLHYKLFLSPKHCKYNMEQSKWYDGMRALKIIDPNCI